jgi:hypothetical protein
LPDGYFSDQASQFGYILEDLGIENVDIYSGHLEYFTTIGYILLWAFDNFVVIWYVGMLYQEKSGNPGVDIYGVLSAFWRHFFPPNLFAQRSSEPLVQKIFLAGKRNLIY